MTHALDGFAQTTVAMDLSGGKSSALIASEMLSPALRQGKPPKRIRIPDMPAARSEVVLRALTRIGLLQALPDGWDGRRAKPATDVAFEVAAGVVVGLIDEHGPSLQMVPLPRGGVQLEWHVMGNDLEIEVGENGNIHVLATTDRDEDVIDRELAPTLFNSALVEIRQFYARLSRLLAEAQHSD